MKLYNPEEEQRARILSVTRYELDSLCDAFQTARIDEVDTDLFTIAVEDEVVLRVRVERTN